MEKNTIHIDYPHTKRRGKIANGLMWGITIFSLITMFLSSIGDIEASFHFPFLIIEIIISFLFLIDILVRAHMSGWKRKFFINVFTIFDILSSIPFLIAFWFHGYLALDYLKVIRVIRIFRVFRLGKYFTFLDNFRKAIKKNAYKYKIAGGFFLIGWLISSFLIYAVEGATNPVFNSIPNAMRWAVVTMSTVGYGDMYPHSVMGKIVWVFVILLGPIFLAIISSISIITFLDVMKYIRHDENETSICGKCKALWHNDDAMYCRVCWEKLPQSTSNSYMLDNY